MISHQDLIIQEQILPHCKAIIRSTYERYQWTQLPYDIAFAAGELGVWRAVNGFDPSAGLPTVYIAYHVRSEIQDAAMAHRGFPASWRRFLKSVMETAVSLETRSGTAPSPNEIALHLKLPLAKVEYALAVLHQTDIEDAVEQGDRRVRVDVENAARREQNAIDSEPFAHAAWLQAKAILHEALPVALRNPLWHAVLLEYTMQDSKHQPTQEEVALKYKISVKTVQRADRAIRTGLEAHRTDLERRPRGGKHQFNKDSDCWVCRLGVQTSKRGLSLEDMFSILCSTD